MDKLRIQDQKITLVDQVEQRLISYFKEKQSPTMTSWDFLEEEIRPLYTDFLLKRNVEMQKINEI